MTYRRTVQIILLLVCLPLTISAQEAELNFTDGLLIQASFASRLPPVTIYEPNQDVHQVGVFYNLHDQLSGPGFRLGIGYMFPKNDWWVSYNHTFRYDAVYYHRYYTSPQPNSATVDVPAKSLIYDMTISISKGISQAKYKPFVTVGGGLMNRGTYYMEPIDYDTVGGQVIVTAYRSRNFHFGGIQTGVGIRYNDFMVEMSAYWVYQDVFLKASILCIPELRISYTIRKKENDPIIAL